MFVSDKYLFSLLIYDRELLLSMERNYSQLWQRSYNLQERRLVEKLPIIVFVWMKKKNQNHFWYEIWSSFLFVLAKTKCLNQRIFITNNMWIIQSQHACDTLACHIYSNIKIQISKLPIVMLFYKTFAANPFLLVLCHSCAHLYAEKKNWYEMKKKNWKKQVKFGTSI